MTTPTDATPAGDTAGTAPAATDPRRATRAWDGIAEPVWSADAYGGPEVTRALTDIAAIGARTVTLIPTWYVEDTTTSLPSRDPEQTTTDAALRSAIETAHRLGLAVLLKPHVDLPDDGDRAEIVPSDPAAWFSRYREMLVGYARLAADTGVERFSVGTELAGTMSAVGEWQTTIASVRAAYRGELTYAANYDSYRDVPFWSSLDVIGIDAYFELVDRPTTDVSTLVAAWTPILDGLGSFAARVGKPVAFTEAGYVSRRGTTTEPWNWELTGPRSDAEQDAGYRALLRSVADRPWFVGVQWWMWDDLSDTGEDQTVDYTPHGKAAGDTLRRAWSEGAAP